MNKELEILFDELLDSLRKAQNSESRKIAIEAYLGIIHEVENFLKVDTASFQVEFASLCRYMSEYLPYTDDVGKVWNLIRKKIDLEREKDKGQKG